MSGAITGFANVVYNITQVSFRQALAPERVPVPPPSPAVTKTMSAPFSASFILVATLRRRARPDLGVAAGAEAAGQLLADRELDVGVARLERPRVSVLCSNNELDATDTGVDHPTDGIGATAACSDDLDYGQVSGFDLPISPARRPEGSAFELSLYSVRRFSEA